MIHTMTGFNELDLINNGNIRLYSNLRKRALKLLKEANEMDPDINHVVFGVLRNPKGQLNTFFDYHTDITYADHKIYSMDLFGTRNINAVHMFNF